MVMAVLSGTRVILLAVALAALATETSSMSRQRRLELAEEAKDMFYHGYDAYMDNAFPADELMPLSCQGRFRGVQPDRGDLDDALGNFSLTLIDSLDTLVVMGDVEEFERGVRLVVDTVTFDRDVAVSVFETNIRVVGGLVSAHILAELLKGRGHMAWYQGQMLDMALDVGHRLLPAFNSTTGLPHPRVNLRHGIKTGKVKSIGETCTACAGTMILEFAALSRLSGEPIFEEKASRAMDVLWAARHRMSNLVGNVLNIQTGDWVRRDSGVGAGIDSYYEYVAKAYVLLGEDKYFDRWQIHYDAVMKWLGSRSYVLQDVHMHKPQSHSKPFVDALGAFWPGLQVLMGDVKPAIESHEVLYQIMQRHNFIPEAFTADFQVHWGQYLLRPEFVESTYFLHRATGDPHYLEVGEEILRSLQKHARVTCGYATIKDVRTLLKEDRMDSFVLSETFKYLYLLFADEANSIVDIHDFVFTTEGHLLPLSLARLSNRTAVPLNANDDHQGKRSRGHLEAYDSDVESSRSCPSVSYLFPDGQAGTVSDYAASIRLPLANVVADKCPTKKITHRRLLASEFQSNSPEHLAIIKDMGITFMSLPDGRVQLLHTAGNAKTPQDSEEGVVFMQEMIELSKQQAAAAGAASDTNYPPRALSFIFPGSTRKVTLVAGPAQFGREVSEGFSLTGEVVVADPIKSCEAAANGQNLWGKIVLVERGDCMFVEKARILESHGAKGGIVLDNNPESTSVGSNIFAMSGDGTDDVSIPMVFLFANDGKTLLKAMAAAESNLVVTISDSPPARTGPAPPGSTADEAEDSPFDITSPVSSFLEKSRRQMEHYLRGVLSSPSPSSIHYEEMDEGKMDETSFDNETSSTTSASDLEPEVDFTSIESLLNPDSESIRTQVENYVIKNPKLLTELLSVNFSDLVTVFKDILEEVVRERPEAPHLEEAYVRLFEVIEARGAEGVRDLAGGAGAGGAADPSAAAAKVIKVVDNYLQAGSELQFDILRDENRVAALLDLMEDRVAVDHDDEQLDDDEL